MTFKVLSVVEFGVVLWFYLLKSILKG